MRGGVPASCMACSTATALGAPIMARSHVRGPVWFMGDLMKGADIALQWGICTWATKFGGAIENKVPNAPLLLRTASAMEPGMVVHQISI